MFSGINLYGAIKGAGFFALYSEVRRVIFQEFLSLTVVRHEALHFCPECGGVVMVADMRKLVYNDIVDGCVGVEHKAARKADGILAGARAASQPAWPAPTTITSASSAI